MWQWITVGVLAVLVTGVYYFAFSAPSNFSSGNLVVIAQGTPASEVAQELTDAHVIRQPFLLRLVLHVGGGSMRVQAGIYRFTSPENLFTVARRIVSGEYGLPPVRLTFIEGATVRDMAAQIVEVLPQISNANFLAKAKPHEGYLFPDTYFFSPASTIDEMVATMRANFNTKIASLSSDISASGHSLADIVTMASLVEKEARTTENRRIVAGILWNRLARGMPLQVDAVFGYIFNRDTYSPSFVDLTTASPHNLYLHKGLPPGPINNPGLDALEAVLHPTQTKYVYYLTGTDGLMHYATTYAEHQANRRKYLQ